MSTIVTRAGKGSPLTHTEVDNNFTNLNTDKAEDNTVVKLSGDQTIAGTKTFSSTITGSITGNAGTVTNGVVTTGSYANPSWITSLDDGKVLPSMSGNSGKYLTTNGTDSSWGTLPLDPSNVTITGGSINNTTVGASTPSTGAFTTLSASGAFSANGGATLGDSSGDSLTINSNAASIPNGLNFDSNTLVIDATNNRIGVGTASPQTSFVVSDSSSNGFELVPGGTSILQLYNRASSAYIPFRIDASEVRFAINATVGAQLVSGGNFQFNSGYGSVATAYACRAWVTFNGTGTPAIRGSGNVSSITDNGTGDYTVNFTNAMPDANYCICATGHNKTGAGGYARNAQLKNTPLSSSATVVTDSITGLFDIEYINVSIFR